MNYKEKSFLYRNIISKYFEIYSSNQFKILPALPLIAKDDISLEFVNCTICSAKKNIQNKKSNIDYVMLQPSIRTQSIRSLLNLDTENNLTTYFNMIGGYKDITYTTNYEMDIENIVRSDYEFLNYFFPDKRIIITIPYDYINFFNCLIDNDNLKCFKNLIIEVKEKEKENLTWKYGIKNIWGCGIRWEIESKDNLYNWGNSIVVFDGSKKIGIDFGGGVETLIKVYFNLSHSIFASYFVNDFVYRYIELNPFKLNFIDCMLTTVIVYNLKLYHKDTTAKFDYILDTLFSVLVSYKVYLQCDKKTFYKLLDSLITHVEVDHSINKEFKSKFEEKLKKNMFYLSFLYQSESIQKLLRRDTIFCEKRHRFVKKSHKKKVSLYNKITFSALKTMNKRRIDGNGKI